MSNQMIKYDRPEFHIQMDVAGCAYQLRINDVIFHEEMDGYPVVAELPVNVWIADGENELGFVIVPVPGAETFDSDTEVTLKITAQDKSRPDITKVEIANLSYSFSVDNTEQSAAEPERRIERRIKFEASAPFPKWSWMSGAAIEDKDDAFAKIQELLQKLHSALDSGDMEEVSKIIKVRDQETAIANYIGYDDQRKRTIKEYQQILDLPDWQLAPLESEGLGLRIYGNNRLARIDDQNGKSPLYFENDDMVSYAQLICKMDLDHVFAVCR